LSEELTKLQKDILGLILRENRRPSAIAKTLRRYDEKVDQNGVMLALVDLEKRGLVERSTTKAWIAKGKAADFLESD
jgi:DNA-binding PadR family transcriptional regulator